MALCYWTLAGAAAPEPNVGFERRAWSPIEGAPTGAWRITQGDDGMLWFASPNGLFRFDGEQFQRVDAVYGYPLRSHNVASVVAARGRLIVMYQFGGLSVFSRDAAQHYDVGGGLPPGVIQGAWFDEDGRLHAGTSSGASVLEGGVWRRTADPSFPSGPFSDVVVDHQGTTWVSTDTELYARPRAVSRYEYVSDILVRGRPELVDGKLTVTAPDHSLVQFEYGKPKKVVLDKVGSIYEGIYNGPLSTVWGWLGEDKGLVLLRPGKNGRYEVARSFESGRTDKSVVVSAYLDREDNLWLCTFNGVERYRAQRIHEIALPGTMFNFYVQQGLDDSMLVAGQAAGSVLRLTDTGFTTQWNLPEVAALWRENAGSLWAGSATGLFHLTRQGMTRWALPAEAVGRGGVQSLVVGKDGVVWVSLVRSGLYRFAGGAWQHFDTAMMGKDATPIFLYVNKAGRVFMGFTKNRIGELVGGVLRALPTSAVDIGHVLSLLEVDGHLLAGGELGMAWVGPQGSRAFQPEQMKALLGVSGLALDRRGDLWAHGADGVFHITRDELARFWAQPQQPLKWEVFNLTDGVRGNAAQIRPLPSLVAGNDGRVFYATNTQVGWIDPLHVRRNALAPHVMVQSIRAGDRQFQPRGVLRLAPGTTAVEIRYAATALSIPEKVKIRYKLSGVDSGWQEPGGERIARYTNLAPGQYVFQVIAANEDGVWNNQGATQQIEILPQLWQTTWFRAAVAALVLLAALALHRWRIAAVEARSAERLAARLDERERIARNLHDNLLQGVYALILRCSTILKRLPPESQEKRILEEALDRADRLIDHTRDEVMGLRDNQSASQAVAALRDQLAAMEPLLQGRLTLRVSDGVERIRPYVACEICQVIKEAVVNAARHSGASAIAATLEVRAGGIVVAIVDNGVGIAADVAEAGVAGHWGIVGMRERVAALSGVLSIGREGERGTAVRFTVSAASGFS